jgi:hypothetical protein
MSRSGLEIAMTRKNDDTHALEKPISGEPEIGARRRATALRVLRPSENDDACAAFVARVECSETRERWRASTDPSRISPQRVEDARKRAYGSIRATGFAAMGSGHESSPSPAWSAAMREGPTRITLQRNPRPAGFAFACRTLRQPIMQKIGKSVR